MNESNPSVPLTLRDNFLVRWGALLLLSLTMLFAYMFVDVLSPIKTMVETQLGWSSSVFGTYGGSEFFLNVFAFFLIFAGIILDRMGIRFTAILSGGLMVVGALIKVYALSEGFSAGNGLYDALSSFAPSFPASAKLACVGFALFGCGTEMAGVTVSRALVKWFEGKELALAMGAQVAIARLGVFAIFWLSPYLAERFETVQAPVIFCAALLCIGLLLYLVYGVMDKALDKTLSEVSTEEEEPFRLGDLKKVFGNAAFWVVALLCMLYYSAIFPFQKFASEMLTYTVGLDPELAPKLFSLFPMGAVVLTPLLGGFLDAFGKGATMLIVGSILVFVCHITFALYPFQGATQGDTIVAITAIVVLGVSFSLVPATLWPSVPKLIDSKVLGSAFSAIFWIQNVGLMSVPILIGWILDTTNSSVPEGEPKDYTYAMITFASFGIAALLLSLLLKSMDARHGYGLERPNL